MKKLFLLLTTAAIVATTIYSCSKETVPEPEQTDYAADEEIGSLIRQFAGRMEAYKQGLMYKSNEKISIDSAIWYIDATLNFTYANANHPFARLHWDTVFVEMNVLNSYEAMYQQVFESYDASLDGLAERYHAITGENKQFMMAIVEDMGPLPANRRNLRVITVNGTGTLQHTGDFGDTETYRFEDFAEWDCLGNYIGTNAPKRFEALLNQYYNPDPGNNCRWYFYGGTDMLFINYMAHQINNPPVNYLDYKIFAASAAVAPIDEWTECLEYNYNNSGIHEMQFYFDHKKDLINAWVSSAQNTGNKRFASSLIESEDIAFEALRYIWHEPHFYFRKRGLECTMPITPPER